MVKEKCETVTLDVDATKVKRAMKKVRRLVKLLKEANSLADELASKNLEITIRI